MPKTSVHGGYSNAWEPQPEPAAPEPAGPLAEYQALSNELHYAEADAEDVAAPDPSLDSTLPASSPESSDPGDDEPADYDAYPIRDLRELCRARGLRIAGSKAELVARLEEADTEQAPQAASV